MPTDQFPGPLNLPDPTEAREERIITGETEGTKNKNKELIPTLNLHEK